MKKSKELKIGVIVALAIAALIWGMNFLKSKNIFKPSDEFIAIYDNVDGLTTSNPVMINGLKVGQVEEIYFDGRATGKLTVLFSMEEDFLIPKKSIAKIISSDLLGTKAIEIKIIADNEYFHDGDTLPGILDTDFITEIKEQVIPIKEKVERLIIRIDSTLYAVESIIDPQTRIHIQQSFRNIDVASGSFKNIMVSQQSSIEKAIASLQTITQNIEKNNQYISDIIKNVSVISDSVANSNLKQAIDNASNMLKETSALVATINEGKGTLGKALYNDSLYYNLEDATKSLTLLLEDLKLHPKKYVHFSVFGKKEQNQ